MKSTFKKIYSAPQSEVLEISAQQCMAQSNGGIEQANETIWFDDPTI